MPFTASQIRVIETQPYKWTTPPTYNPDGTVLTPGVAGIPLDGVFILIDDDVIAALKNNLTAAQKTEIQSWAYVLWTDEDTNPARPVNQRLATWIGAVGWSGSTRHVFLRIPAATWNTPTGTPPAKVIQYLQWLHR